MSACLAGSIVLQRMGVEFILFNLHSRESSRVDRFVKWAQADSSRSSRASWEGKGSWSCRQGRCPPHQGLSPTVWDRCLKPGQGWDEADTGRTQRGCSTAQQSTERDGPEHKELLSPGEERPSRAAHGSIPLCSCFYVSQGYNSYPQAPPQS